MKPIKLSMTAFGPFAHTEVIDFTEIEKERIFLICGPTGAGKTTIFDAISYALFGDASGEERKAEGMRSDFAPDDVLTEVELTFSVKNRIYRIFRQPRQMKPKKNGGGFTEVAGKAELEYTDEQGNFWSFTKNAEIAEKVKEFVGLGSEQFKQIIMLPQGEFRKLLTADSKEREMILRDIFDAKKYQQFQVQLKMECEELEHKIKEYRNIRRQWVLQLQTEEDDGELHNLLNQEEIDHKELSKAVESQNKKDMSTADEHRRNAEHYAQEMNLAKQVLFAKTKENQKLQELRQLQAEIENLKARENEIKEKEALIGKIGKAISLKGYAEHCVKLEKQFQQIEQELQLLTEKSQRAQQQKETLENQYQHIKSEEYQIRCAEMEKEILELQQQIPLISSLLDLRAKYAILRESCKEKEKYLQDLTERKKNMQNLLKSYRQEIVENIEEKKNHIEKKVEKYQKLRVIYRKYSLALQQSSSFEEQEREIHLMEEEVRKEYQRVTELVRQNHVLAICRELQEGDVCPVCQQTYHGNTELSAEMSEVPDIHAVEMEQQRIQERKQQFLAQKAESLAIEKALLEQLFMESGFSEKKQVEDFLSIEEKQYTADTEELRFLLEQISKQKKIQQSIKKIEKEEEELLAAEEAAASDFTKEQAEMNLLAGEGKALKQNILPKYEEQIHENMIFDLEIQLEKKVEARQKQKQSEEELEKSYQTVIRLAAETETAQKSMQLQKNNLQIQWKEEEKEFQDKLEQTGFSDRRSWEEALQKEQQLSEYEKSCREYRENQLRVWNQEKLLQKEVTIEKEHDLKEIQENIENLEKAGAVHIEKAVLLVRRAEENRRIIKELEQMEAERELLKSKYFEIAHFAKVANGDNLKKLTFERYVLAAFLEDVLAMANVRLEKMTGRYQLRRKEEVTHRGRQSGLEIEVLDAYTGKTRSVNTLSGGESFKAALAMALGLSEVVSSYAGGIELDMLFIDEGFGTLDPESLDMAIDCIMDLQAKGKIIGIISHVAELKERIPAKLEVIQTNRGSYTRYCLGEMQQK